MKNEVIMEIDLRKHSGVREAVHAGLKALLVQGRQIWEGAPLMGAPPKRHALDQIVVRLMVGVGDLARLNRDGHGVATAKNENGEEREYVWRDGHGVATAKNENGEEREYVWRRELKKELGNILFSTVRWIDDLGLDPLECLELAIAAQEKFVASGRPR
jgi:hypothetical protein